MTTGDIQGHLEEIYGIEVSPALISEVTDAVTEEVSAWQKLVLYIQSDKELRSQSLNEIEEILSNLGLGFLMKLDAQGRIVMPRQGSTLAEAGSREEAG